MSVWVGGFGFQIEKTECFPWVLGFFKAKPKITEPTNDSYNINVN